MYIYMITYIANGFSYVGQCVGNVNLTKGYYGSGIYIKAAIKKHGKENFTKTILEILSEDSTKCELSKRERFWIKEKNTLYPNGYNLTEGGEKTIGLKQTAEHIKKRIESRRNNGRPWMPDGWAERHSKFMKGRFVGEKSSNWKGGPKICYCIECGDERDYRNKSKFCKKCSIKGNRNPAYGKPSTIAGKNGCITQNLILASSSKKKKLTMHYLKGGLRDEEKNCLKH